MSNLHETKDLIDTMVASDLIGVRRQAGVALAITLTMIERRLETLEANALMKSTDAVDLKPGGTG